MKNMHKSIYSLILLVLFTQSCFSIYSSDGLEDPEKLLIKSIVCCVTNSVSLIFNLTQAITTPGRALTRIIYRNLPAEELKQKVEAFVPNQMNKCLACTGISCALCTGGLAASACGCAAPAASLITAAKISAVSGFVVTNIPVQIHMELQ